jgi:pimeloyl-ACP methyl ester carboxylesterase
MSAAPVRPTLLLVHGAWHGSWCWEELETELAAQGWKSQTVDLPSAVRTESAGLLPDVLDDVRVIRDAIDDIDGPVVVVAHSYGGIPVTQATADTSNVVHVVYVAAYQLDVDESMFSIHGAPQPDPMSVKGIAQPVANPAASFYADVPDIQKANALARLVQQSGRSFADQVTRAGWHTVPSSYIVCDNDQVLPPAIQEKMSSRAGAIYHLASSHSPFLSMPGELASLLAKIAG